MVHIGDKIRQLREEKKISRPVFCGDESELSIRQLVRIENGESSPTIERIQYIADRLGVPSYQLMIDYEELPARYKELKYVILRQPTYGVKSKLEHLQELLDEIFEQYYDDLPVDEQLIIDCTQAKIEIVLSNDIRYAEGIIEENIHSFREKEYLSISDLSFFRLLSVYFEIGEETGQVILAEYLTIFSEVFEKILDQTSFFNMEDLFIVANAILSGLAHCDCIGDYSLYPKGVDSLKAIFDETQDYQKRPLISMLEWKIDMFEKNDVANATFKYEKAKDLAKLLNIEPMIAGLDLEWKKDLEKFYKK